VSLLPDETEIAMTSRRFNVFIASVGAAFALAFAITVVPPLWKQPDILGAFAAGFVNPYSSGYAMDAICCWLILAAWVLHEARVLGIKHGWIAIVLGIVPGVATGFAFYLILRSKQRARLHPSS